MHWRFSTYKRERQISGKGRLTAFPSHLNLLCQVAKCYNHVARLINFLQNSDRLSKKSWGIWSPILRHCGTKVRFITETEKRAKSGCWGPMQASLFSIWHSRSFQLSYPGSFLALPQPFIRWDQKPCSDLSHLQYTGKWSIREIAPAYLHYNFYCSEGTLVRSLGGEYFSNPWGLENCKSFLWGTSPKFDLPEQTPQLFPSGLTLSFTSTWTQEIWQLSPLST